MKTPSYEYELLHQFEVIFRDGEHKTQAATRDYSKVWENVIDNPPEEGVTPIHVYRMNGTTCAVIAGMDELVENEECAMEIARLLAAMQREREVRAQLVEALEKSLATITDKRIGTVGYMEGSRIYMDFADSAKVINAALLAAKELEG